MNTLKTGHLRTSGVPVSGAGSFPWHPAFFIDGKNSARSAGRPRIRYGILPKVLSSALICGLAADLRIRERRIRVPSRSTATERDLLSVFPPFICTRQNQNLKGRGNTGRRRKCLVRLGISRLNAPTAPHEPFRVVSPSSLPNRHNRRPHPSVTSRVRGQQAGTPPWDYPGGGSFEEHLRTKF